MIKRVLVVDDEPDAVELVAFNLKAAGFEVISAEDGEMALKKARNFSPDLIVLDVMLPSVNGLEVAGFNPVSVSYKMSGIMIV